MPPPQPPEGEAVISTLFKLRLKNPVSTEKIFFLSIRTQKCPFDLHQGTVQGGKNIRVIGHSLGGHTAGITGKKFFEKYKLEKISRIDAIDPAGPNFDHSPSEFQLTEFNGDFVQVMHCNTGLLGSKMNRGHADFYPNGGDNLPGCEPPNGTRRRRSLTSNAEKHICNHLRCIDLYIEMLQEEQVGCKCASWKKFLDNQCDCATSTDKPRMGYFCPETAKGTYYLNVTMNSKFDYGNTTAPKEREDATSKLIGGMQETSSQLLTSISEMTKGVEPPTNDPAHEPITATTPKPENVTTT
ncbi:pancreatic lipase-related protein 2-like [Folsomia candida]|uniref:pancreatic lipase-related protein 2-like n=1 Tax=Folsomia candida TaxID=158441 RepID=UPI0016055845|nr:pancreatic lipase-related protein 2-like [Folsomia candida]